jgi:hypothetical protein
VPLSLAPLSLPSSRVALALAQVACPTCEARAGDDKGGEVWISFRGDWETCAPSRVGGGVEFDCHADHSARLNKVMVHFVIDGTTTELWYWLGGGEVYSTPTGGLVVRVCSIGEDSAIVAVDTSVPGAAGKCEGKVPPGAPPSSPEPPSPPPAQCKCHEGQWTYHGKTMSGCANPDNDPVGAWCLSSCDCDHNGEISADTCWFYCSLTPPAPPPGASGGDDDGEGNDGDGSGGGGGDDPHDDGVSTGSLATLVALGILGGGGAGLLAMYLPSMIGAMGRPT